MSETHKRIPLWHSLMYSTGILLLVCGIPATVVLSFWSTSQRSANLSSSEAVRFGVCMVGFEALLACMLLFVAERLTKRRSR